MRSRWASEVESSGSVGPHPQLRPHRGWAQLALCLLAPMLRVQAMAIAIGVEYQLEMHTAKA